MATLSVPTAIRLSAVPFVGLGWQALLIEGGIEVAGKQDLEAHLGYRTRGPRSAVPPKCCADSPTGPGFIAAPMFLQLSGRMSVHTSRGIASTDPNLSRALRSLSGRMSVHTSVT